MLDNQLKSPPMRSQLSRFMTAMTAYSATLDKIQQITSDRNKLILNELDRIGPEVSTATLALNASLGEDQTSLGTNLNAQNATTVSTVIWVSLSAILTGIFLAWVLVRIIKKPLGGEPREMEEIARRIADGDLTVTFRNRDSATGVYRAMMDMSESISNIIEQVRSGADNLSSASHVVYRR